jgi:hypothetical protein
MPCRRPAFSSSFAAKMQRPSSLSALSSLHDASSVVSPSLGPPLPPRSPQQLVGGPWPATEHFAFLRFQLGPAYPGSPSRTTEQSSLTARTAAHSHHSQLAKKLSPVALPNRQQLVNQTRPSLPPRGAEHGRTRHTAHARTGAKATRRGVVYPARARCLPDSTSAPTSRLLQPLWRRRRPWRAKHRRCSVAGSAIRGLSTPPSGPPRTPTTGEPNRSPHPPRPAPPRGKQLH